MIPLAIAGCLFVGVALNVAAAFAQAADRHASRARLGVIDDASQYDVRQRALAASLGTRLGQPLLRFGGLLAHRLWPSNQLETTRTRLARGGITRPDAAERFVAAQVTGLVVASISIVVVLGALRSTSMSSLALCGLLAAGATLGPSTWLSRHTRARQLAMARALPDILDLLTISVEAGLGFEQALDRVVRAIPGPLCDEFGRMLGEIRAGASRSEALRSMEARADVPEIRSFILALIQADTFGVSIGRILRAQAEEMRIKRRQTAQERAQKAPVKMLVPMVFCVFPALFVVVIGPAVISLSHGFLK